MSYYQGDYYQGDYYQGDYYQGDPFLGALIGMGASWLGKKLIGRGLSKTAQLTAGSAIIKRTRGPVAAGALVATMGTLPIPLTPFQVSPTKFLPGGAPFISRRGEPVARFDTSVTAAGCACPSGFHMAKDGSGRCVRNRAMNVANPRALRRSLRRVSGFAKLAKRSRTSIKKAAREV